MTKNYPPDKFVSLNSLQPKQETIDFIIAYSQALRIFNCEVVSFELVLN